VDVVFDVDVPTGVDVLVLVETTELEELDHRRRRLQPCASAPC
jgi:hypothetical protein